MQQLCGSIHSNRRVATMMGKVHARAVKGRHSDGKEGEWVIHSVERRAHTEQRDGGSGGARLHELPPLNGGGRMVIEVVEHVEHHVLRSPPHRAQHRARPQPCDAYAPLEAQIGQLKL